MTGAVLLGRPFHGDADRRRILPALLVAGQDDLTFQGSAFQRLGSRGHPPALDQVGPGHERAVQRVERDRDNLDLRGVRDRDLDLGIRVRAVHLELHGENILAVDVLRVGVDPLHARQPAVPVEVEDAERCSRFAFVPVILVISHSALPLLLSTFSQGRRRKRTTAGGKRTTAGGDASGAVAAETRDIVRRAAGDVVGKTVAAQVRQAARNLGYPAEDWRVREAWYGRAGSWSAAAVDDLRQRFAAWRAPEQGQAASAPADSLQALAQRLSAIRRDVAEVMRQVDELASEIAKAVEGPR